MNFSLKNPTKMKKVFLILLFLIQNFGLLESTDPGTVISAFGYSVGTSRMIQRIESRLAQQNSNGIPLRYKDNHRCLDSDWRTGPWSYATYLNLCNERKQTQKWRLIDGELKVGSNRLVLQRFMGRDACLTCWSRLWDCFLYVRECRSAGILSHRYFIRIHPSQIDLGQGQIYFSIHSSMWPDRCLAPYDKQNKKLYLQDCEGNSAQSFYLNGLDFASELDLIRSRLFVDGGTVPTFYYSNKNLTNYQDKTRYILL